MATPRDSPQESRDSPRGDSRASDFAGNVSCNFPTGSGVVASNDVSTVHNSEAGVAAPVDFTTFMRNYQDMVFSTAVRLTNNEAQAEDIAQEVFLKAYENFDHLATSRTAGGWLKTVATNLSLNHLTRYRRRWRFFSEFRRDDEADDRDAPSVEFAAPDTFFLELDAEERRGIVDAALAELPSHQRLPLVLFHFEEMPYDEIARKLGVSLAKVKTDILRGRAALAKILQHPGSAHPELKS
jgi:RNA polymerase sigma-70 factor (ECF subfamily)